jgi:hypothetical protein
MKSMGWVLPTLVGVGVGAGIGWYFGSQSAAAKAAERIADVAANAMRTQTAPPAPPNPNLGGLYGHHYGHMGAVSLMDPRAERMRAGYSQVSLPGRNAMGLGAAYASIPGMAHFPGQSARAGYRNAMGY